MHDDCDHQWRTGPIVHAHLRRQAVCLTCLDQTSLSEDEAAKWPAWTEEDYWNNLDRLEGDRAPEIRKARG